MLSSRSRKIGKFVLWEVAATAILAIGGIFGGQIRSWSFVAQSDGLQRLLGEHGFVFGILLPALIYVAVGGLPVWVVSFTLDFMGKKKK